ncbi:glycosyltransferase family 4 protein [Polaribacter sp. Q13]|uniref:glycosyltransferase family 4 protein n=1 Tax=Polaribacter sp. Q13 TaxID=2806551 RepID=UPI00193BE2A8|nr:glycosyltransferase family 4 protein [Polaribacter sp. Q13]QVY66621.1 glycosyltransferase family 4 protein [Polaribacter sp. Q13]
MILKKKNILFLLHLPPPVHGSSMVGKFIKDSKYINEQVNGDYLNLLASNNVSETGKISLNKVMGFVNVWFALFFKLLKKKPALCYFAITATGAAFFRDVLLISLLKIFRVKCMYHMHNKGVSKYQNSKIYNSCYKFIFKNAEVILLSKHLYKDIKKYVPLTKIHICPNGIPEIELDEKKNDDVDKKTVKILFLSNLIKSKGVFILVEACKLLKERGIGFKCNFIGGEGDITAEILKNKVDSLNLNNEINYLGKKYGDDKTAFLNEADLFVFPTYYSNECFPLVLLEAMQFNLPIISTFEGGIADIVEDGVTGILVSQNDVVSLAEKLEYLINNAEVRVDMGLKGKAKFDKEFTLEVFEKKMLSILLNSIDT